MKAIPDMKQGELYLGKYKGGFWKGWKNDPPNNHMKIGLDLRAGVVPLNKDGYIDYATGKVILMTLGYSNMTHLSCCEQHGPQQGMGWGTPQEYSMIYKAEKYGMEDNFVWFNAARGGQTPPHWYGDKGNENYAYIRDELENRGLSRLQVQEVIFKCSLAGSPERPKMPDPNSDAWQLSVHIANAVRAIKTEYPNVAHIFLMPRSCGGYADPVHSASPEPYAYETGFAVKRVILAQDREIRKGKVSKSMGQLWDENNQVLLTWGPYLWSDKDTRCDYTGLSYSENDYEDDFTHLNEQGRSMQANYCLNFFLDHEFSSWWFNPENG